jgi:hypothetical protein
VSYLSTQQKLSCLRAKFTEQYEFLTVGIMLMRGDEQLPADMIPALNFKEGAVLNTWMELTPEGARHLFKSRLVQGTYNDLNTFFTAFFKVVRNPTFCPRTLHMRTKTPSIFKTKFGNFTQICQTHSLIRRYLSQTVRPLSPPSLHLLLSSWKCHTKKPLRNIWRCYPLGCLRI